MTDGEHRALARTTLILFLAAAARWGWAQREPAPLVPADSASALPGLLAESRNELDDAERRDRPLAGGELLDPNTASDADLDRLPGVGAATARAIVDAREASGPFSAPEDLLRVRGIGPATLERMRPHLAIGGRGSRIGAVAPAPTAVAGRARPGRSSVPAGEPASHPLDLNVASAEELEALPGVGPALAARIVEARGRLGRFSTVDDLLEVRGIGPVVLERLRPRVAVP